MHRVIERVLNLLAFLLTVGRPVSADEIRHTVAGYDQKSDEAFRRTFERDKDLLRDLGVPLRLAFTDAYEVEKGYVVRPEEYALPDPGLTDEERTALWLAMRMARLGGEESGPAAIFKLGGAALAGGGEPLSADLGTDITTLGDLFGAVVERRKIRFAYRGRRRTASPYGLVHRRGHWYLVGASGDGTRTFRVDRMEKLEVGEDAAAFERPKGFRAAAGIAEAPFQAGSEEIEAVVRFDASVAWWARRQLPADAAITEPRDGSITVRMRVGSVESFIGWMIAFEDAAVIESPKELRDRFVAHLKVAS